MLLQQFDTSIPVAGIKNVDITGIQEDSRLVRPGDLFIARPGAKADGRQFILDAAARGAVAVVSEQSSAVRPLVQVVVKNVAQAASVLANAFHEMPARKVQVVGVTGTNGKTTTTYLIRHLLASVKRRCGMIGTVEIDDGRSTREATMTTPGAVEIAQLLATHARQGLLGVRDGSFQPCTGPGKSDRCAFCGGGVYQSDGRSSGLSQDDGQLRRGQGEAV